MSAAEFISSLTVERPGAAITLAQLRRAYVAKFGPISRGGFIAELSRAGFTLMAPEGRQTFLLNRAMAPLAAMQPA